MKPVLTRKRLDYYYHLASTSAGLNNLHSVNVDAGELIQMVSEIKRLRHLACKPNKKSPAVPAQS